MKTREEVEQLKAEWEQDPIWDIEHTPGFEEYFSELKQWHEKCAAEWERDNERRASALAERLGCPGNTTLARYIDFLERSIRQLEDRVYKLEEKNRYELL
jgi:polyhydroxyalkanoate synthesis regulator phasin